jgi:hypothetical protein
LRELRQQSQDKTTPCGVSYDDEMLGLHAPAEQPVVGSEAVLWSGWEGMLWSEAIIQDQDERLCHPSKGRRNHTGGGAGSPHKPSSMDIEHDPVLIELWGTYPFGCH